MEHVIAVAVELESGGSRYFVTWGRVHDAVDTGPVCEAVLRASSKFALGDKAVSARVCYSLQEAALSTDAPYFFECLLAFDMRTVPTDAGGYEQWRRDKVRALERGADISYCGNPHQRLLYNRHHGLVEADDTPP